MPKYITSLFAASFRRFTAALPLIAALAVTTVSQPAAMAAVDSPAVSEALGGNGVPVTVGNFDDVAALGYDVREYFVSGNARAFITDQKLTPDGQWNAVRPLDRTAAFRTRVIVYAPTDPQRFNGTVYVEWQNNSGFADASPDWVHGHIEVARQGAAYVLASVQPIGITTLKAADPWWLPIPDVDFAISDPQRYRSLKHPGNKYNYDIFSQTAQAARDGKLLGELQPQRVIGVGESQSALWLTTYINAIQKVAGVYDGFVVHSSFGRGMALGTSALGAGAMTHIRDDLVPVILFQSETDVQLGAMFTRQLETPDGLFRLWEVAGTAHYDSYGLEIGLADGGAGDAEATALEYLKNPSTVAQGGLMHCADGINAGPMHWVYGAALNWMARWVSEGTAPPIAQRLETAVAPGLLPQFVTDEHGNTRGGIRTPFVDVPVATLKGFGNSAAEGAPFISAFCGIFGQTIPFDREKLAVLYPTHEEFASQFSDAAARAVQAGFLLQADADNLIAAAQAYSLGRDDD
jgi:hypothetical protein